MAVSHDLKDLDFVLLTHRHGDHLDLGLLRALRHLPIWWVVPEAILPLVLKQAGLPAKQILVPKPLHLSQTRRRSTTRRRSRYWK